MGARAVVADDVDPQHALAERATARADRDRPVQQQRQHDHAEQVLVARPPGDGSAIRSGSTSSTITVGMANSARSSSVRDDPAPRRGERREAGVRAVGRHQSLGAAVPQRSQS